MSANTKASARGLAYLGGFMANKGTFQGKTILTEEAWEKFHGNPTLEYDLSTRSITRFTDGGVDDMTRPNTRDDMLFMPGMAT